MAVDDDTPLASLTSVKIEDDMPLASLASAAPPKSSAKAAGSGKGRPPAAKPAGAKAAPKGAAGKTKAKAAPKKKPGESSSSDSSSSSSDDSDSSEEGGGKEKKQKPKRPKAAAATKGKRMKLLQKKKSADGVEEGEEGEDGEEDKAAQKIQKRQRTNKQEVVSALLCRWWYVLPDWPPTDDAFYKPRLEEKKLRHVTIQEWEWVPEEDGQGHRKVYQLSQFRGLFRNSSGELIDLRPQETCPCYANMMKKEMTDLYDLLVKAYENQIKDLVNSNYNEEKLKKELETTLNKVKDKAYQAKQIGGIKRSKSA